MYLYIIVLYECETWTIMKDERKRSEASEMWGDKGMLKISWKDIRQKVYREKPFYQQNI